MVQGGCAVTPPAEPLPPTSLIDGRFVNNVADTMMRSLLNASEIADSNKAPRVALLRVRNKTRFAFDPSIFSAKLRADLNSKASQRMIFLDRSNMTAIKNERKGKREGSFTFLKGSLKRAVSGADFFLAGDIRSLSSATQYGDRSDYLHFDFFMVNAESGEIIWEDQFDKDIPMQRMNVIYR